MSTEDTFKFKLLDEVWYMHNNRPVKGTITKRHEIQLSYMASNCGGPRVSRKYEVVDRVQKIDEANCNPWNNRGLEIEERKLFPTIMALVDSIMEEAQREKA